MNALVLLLYYNAVLKTAVGNAGPDCVVEGDRPLLTLLIDDLFYSFYSP